MLTVVVTTSGEVFKKEIDGSLRSMQEIVGGYIERTPYKTSTYQLLTMLVNEDGFAQGLKRNPLIKNRHIVGNVFFLKDSYTTPSSDFEGLSHEQADELVDLFNDGLRR